MCSSICRSHWLLIREKCVFRPSIHFESISWRLSREPSTWRLILLGVVLLDTQGVDIVTLLFRASFAGSLRRNDGRSSLLLIEVIWLNAVSEWLGGARSERVLVTPLNFGHDLLFSFRSGDICNQFLQDLLTADLDQFLSDQVVLPLNFLDLLLVRLYFSFAL